jgi:photosystem II stability/assembly factor-like uncharacterized protein
MEKRRMNILLVLFIFCVTFSEGFAIWEKLKVDEAIYSTKFCLCNDKLVVWHSNIVYVSEDGGYSWGKQYTPFSPDSTFIYDMVCRNDTLFATLYSYYPYGIFLSTDYGKSWFARNNGILFDKVDPLLRFLHLNENEIYVGTLRYFYKSTDGGNNWEVLNDKIPFASGYLRIASMSKWENKIVIVTLYNIGYSDDDGKTYRTISYNPNDENYRVLLLDNYIFVCTKNSGILRSSDNGETWEQKNNGISFEGVVITRLKSYKGILFAGTGYKGLPTPNAQLCLYLSTDLGETWKKIEVDTSKGEGEIQNIEFRNDTIFVNRGGQYVYRAKLSELLNVVPVVEEKVYHFYATEPIPTPTSVSASIRLYWDAPYYNPTPSDIAIYDVFGNRIGSRGDVTITPVGKNSALLHLDCRFVPAGIYFLVVNYLGEARPIRVVVVK